LKLVFSVDDVQIGVDFRISVSLAVQNKKMWKVGFCFYVNTVIIRVGFAVFGWRQCPLGACPTSQFCGL